MYVAIINGPNLSRLGHREPEVYGRVSMDDYIELLRIQYPEIEIGYYQSNHEGGLIDELYHVADSGASGIILNAGAYSHTSIALADAIRAIDVPVVEVHISNIYAREHYRHHSVISAVALGVISGLGMDGYRLALEAIVLHQGRSVK